jgi:hypothetical protein
MTKITDFDAITGEATVRDMDADELLQIKKLKEEAKSRQAELENKESIKAAAEAKLAALGLTPSDLRALGL